MVVVVEPFVVVVDPLVVVVVVVVTGEDPPHKLTPFSERELTLGTGVFAGKVI